MKTIWKILGVIVLLVLVGLSSQIGKIVGKSATQEFEQGKGEDVLEAVLTKTASDLNLKTPFMVDSATRIDNVIGIENILRYNYTLIDYSASEIISQKLHAKLEETVKNKVCTSMKHLISLGATIEFAYYGNRGKQITIISVPPSSCGNPVNTSTQSPTITNIEKSSAPKDPVQAFETIQSAQGATEADFNLAFLNEIENWIVETTYQKGKDNYAAMGFTSENFKSKIVANSTYVIADGKKLAFIKINFDNSTRIVTVIGIKGSDLHRVSCLRSSNHDIPVWSGECGNKINEVFNVSIRP